MQTLEQLNSESVSKIKRYLGMADERQLQTEHSGGIFSALALPSFIEPMLLQPSKVLPVGEQWLYELKFDGYRGLAIKNYTSTRLYSRNGKDFTSRFLPIVHAVQNLRAKFCTLDGEIVCLDSHGRPCFEDLQNYSEGEHALYFYAFDLLHLNGDCLHSLPLTKRKELLAKLLEGAASCLRLSASLDGKPEAMVSFCREHPGHTRAGIAQLD